MRLMGANCAFEKFDSLQALIRDSEPVSTKQE